MSGPILLKWVRLLLDDRDERPGWGIGEAVCVPTAYRQSGRSVWVGGPDGDRTHDLLIAKTAPVKPNMTPDDLTQRQDYPDPDAEES